MITFIPSPPSFYPSAASVMSRAQDTHNSRNKFPDFYLVGAPKCGTTALYDFLRQHPDIFLPETKELLFFGSDLTYPSRLSESSFLAHYADRRSELRVGSSHTAYLQSQSAAEEIRVKRPDAYIIALVRNPLEMLPSWHSELLYQTIEDLSDFEAALDAEPERRHNRRIPRTARNSYLQSLFYSEVAAFGSQLRRYVNVFGETHVHVIVYDDFRSDPLTVYARLLEFLRLGPFTPKLEILNPNKVVRSRALQKIFFASSLPGHRFVRNHIPRAIRQRLLQANVRQEVRPQLPEHLKARLVTMFQTEIAELSELLARDLSSWLTP